MWVVWRRGVGEWGCEVVAGGNRRGYSEVGWEVCGGSGMAEGRGVN